MDQPRQKRTRVEREQWAKRVERWRDSALTTAGFAAEPGNNPKTRTYWAWTLTREASGKSGWCTSSDGRAACVDTAAGRPRLRRAIGLLVCFVLGLAAAPAPFEEL